MYFFFYLFLIENFSLCNNNIWTTEEKKRKTRKEKEIKMTKPQTNGNLFHSNPIMDLLT